MGLHQRQRVKRALAEALRFLKHGGTLEQYEVQLLGSDRFFQGPGGGTVLGFMTAAYRAVLQRRPEPSALARNTPQLGARAPRAARRAAQILGRRPPAEAAPIPGRNFSDI